MKFKSERGVVFLIDADGERVEVGTADMSGFTRMADSARRAMEETCGRPASIVQAAGDMNRATARVQLDVFERNVVGRLRARSWSWCLGTLHYRCRHDPKERRRRKRARRENQRRKQRRGWR